MRHQTATLSLTSGHLMTFAESIEFKKLGAQGIRIWAPPTFALLALDGSNRIVP
jgi:hypothetical protein